MSALPSGGFSCGLESVLSVILWRNAVIECPIFVLIDPNHFRYAISFHSVLLSIKLMLRYKNTFPGSDESA